MRVTLVLLLSFLSISLFGQIDKTFTIMEYMTIVKDNHPVTYQSDLLNDMAAATKRIARGGFDAKIEGGWDYKSFDDKNYYSLGSGAIKVPTWYGIDLKAGYDRSSGVFLNDSDVLPRRGLWSAGISVPLGKGFIIDERRAALKRAEVYREVTAQERIIMVNQVLFKAANAYLNWQTANAFYNIAKEGRQLAEIRFEGTKSSYINGDKPAIDTLESFIVLQTRQLDLQKARQSLENAKIQLNNFLWVDGVIPLELDQATSPETIDIDFLDLKVDSLSLVQDLWLAAHPELLLYDYKIDNLNINQKLAKEDLKPDLRVNFNPLLAVADDALFDQYDANNYKLGASFSYPIMQRKERGKIDLNRLKIKSTEFERSLKNQDLKVKLDTYINNIQATQDQYELLDTTVQNYNRMLIAENRKFEVGESSVFLVNARESKYLESRYKLIELSQKLIFNRFTYLLFSARFKEVL